jgi:hypothetical protein
MSTNAEELKSQLARLPVGERAELAHYLLLSLDEGADLDAETAWDRELALREGEIRSGVAMGEPADSVFRRLRERLQ